jgi:hypothetical protein
MTRHTPIAPTDPTTRIDVRGTSGEDIGYLRDQQRWWFDPAFPHAFELFDIDGFYEEHYFASDHVGPDVVRRVIDAVQDSAACILGRPIRSVLEAGAGGGWFTEELLRRGVDVVAVEGTRVGVERITARGVPQDRILQHDLRRPLEVGRKFDVAICTEVAEHIECPFAGMLVETLTRHADVVWFSFESPGTNEAHYHHTNEQPPKFWVSLFRFHGFHAIELPDAVVRRLEARGRFLFVRADIDVPSALGRVIAVVQSPVSVGSTMMAVPTVSGERWKLAKRLLPPIILDLARAVRRWK